MTMVTNSCAQLFPFREKGEIKKFKKIEEELK